VQECLIVFQGVQEYITPSWYATKQETCKVVPTWNYATVHVWGSPRVIDDAQWVSQQINELTHSQEQQRSAPWEVSDAPSLFIAGQLKGIVGLEIEIARTEGKWKVSQNRPEQDRRGVFDGLREQGEAAEGMAQLVAQYGRLGSPER
jgi:transcriptional regulator